MNRSDRVTQARLLKLRKTNPNWELVFQEPKTKASPEWKPVVLRTMTVLSDGTLAYLFDAGPPLKMTDPKTNDDTARIDWIAACLNHVEKLLAPEGREKVEIDWRCDDDNEHETTVRSGRDVPEAFRKAVDAAMREQREREKSS